MMWTSRPGQLSGKGEKLGDLTVCFAALGEREQNMLICILVSQQGVCKNTGDPLIRIFGFGESKGNLVTKAVRRLNFEIRFKDCQNKPQ